MEELIAKMRSDWAIVSRNRLETKAWSAQDEIEIGQAIKAVIDAKDRNMIACWSRWLADLSAWVVAWNLICRGAEVSMKAAGREHKSKAGETKGAQ